MCEKNYFGNSLLFQEYEEPTELKFIDFQQMTATSPIFDLSYCIYSSAAYNVLANLDHFLNVYYQSLSDMLEVFHLDVQDIYSYNTFKSQWNKHCKFGYSMGLLILKQKLMYKDVEDIKLSEDLYKNLDLESVVEGKYDIKLLKERVQCLVRHMYENGFF